MQRPVGTVWQTASEAPHICLPSCDWRFGVPIHSTSWSQMTSDFMELQPVSLDSQNAMNAIDGTTIEPRIRINRPDEGRGRCRGSRAWDQRKEFSQCMQQHKIPSTSNVILTQQERTEPSGYRPCRHGVKLSLRREPDAPGDLSRALFGSVTEHL
jgi:hypothetical protein